MSANAEKEETEKSENREKRNQSYQEYVKNLLYSYKNPCIN